jgi:hypothetical protein
MTLSHHDLLAAAAISEAGHGGYSHLWRRGLSRRGFIGVAAGAAGAVALRPLLGTTAALAGGAAEPKPIPGGSVPPPVGPHAWLPQRGLEPSTIFDFDGTVALADIYGSGEARQGGHSFPANFNADMRFMSGRYVDLDGVTREGTFGFF